MGAGLWIVEATMLPTPYLNTVARRKSPVSLIVFYMWLKFGHTRSTSKAEKRSRRCSNAM